MMDVTLESLLRLVETARCLSEPGEPNNEYVRGQVNLINDYAGLPGEADCYYRLLTDVITHKITVEYFMTEIVNIMHLVCDDHGPATDVGSDGMTDEERSVFANRFNATTGASLSAEDVTRLKRWLKRR